MSVQERPHELAADVFQAELEMGVLVDGVVPAIERGRADVQPLLVGDLFGRNQSRRVAGARGSNGGIEGMRESVAKSDARGGGFDEFTGGRAFEHTGLRGHDGKLFYTDAFTHTSGEGLRNA